MIQQHHIELDLLSGERWWGGAINSAHPQPYKNGAHEDLSDLRGNSAMPLLLSNRGRVIWSEGPFTMNLRENRLVATANACGSSLVCDDGFKTLRGAYLHASQTYFPPSGRMPHPALFTTVQYNTWIEMTYYSTQERVLAYARAIIDHGFPPGILIIDSLWHPTYGNWVFDTGRYPNPRQMVDELHSMGFLVMLWVIPYITADTLQFRELRHKGYLFRRHDGEPAILRWWDGYSAALDVTNPAAIGWLYQQLDTLIEQTGVDGFKFDGGQPSNYADIGVADPHHATQAWNAVGLRYSLSEYKDSWRSAGWPLAQRIRDRFHTWSYEHEGLRSLIPMGLVQGLLGYSFICPDMIGGGDYQDFPHQDDPNFDAELFVRYAQASALFPMMQFSAAPWRLLDATHLAMCRSAAELHTHMAPTMLALAAHAAQSGEPILRHLAYVFPEGGYEEVDDQFLLGDQILIAPVLERGARTRNVVFPPGRWRGDAGEVIVGPCSQQVSAPLTRIPWFSRVDSIDTK